MTKIKDYTQDTTVSLTDKLVGTDNADNSTKTFSIDSIVSLSNVSPIGVQSISGNSGSIIAGSNRIVFLTAASGAVVLDLHTAVDNTGVVFHFVAQNGNDITIKPSGSEQLDGSAPVTISGGKVSIFAHSGNWYTLL